MIEKSLIDPARPNLLVYPVLQPDFNMASSTYFANNNEADYWPYQSAIGDRSSEQIMFPDSGYQVHQQSSSGYVQQHPQTQELSTTSSSLLETLLRHGKDAIADSYSNSMNPMKPVTPPDGQILQTPPYTPTSSTDSKSPATGYLCPQDIAQETNFLIEGYQGYSNQPQSSVTSSLMTPASPDFAVQQAYGTGYGSNNNINNNNNTNDNNNIDMSNNNNGEQSPELNKFVEEGQPQVDYPWMKSSNSNGLYRFLCFRDLLVEVGHCCFI